MPSPTQSADRRGVYTNHHANRDPLVRRRHNSTEACLWSGLRVHRGTARSGMPSDQYFQGVEDIMSDHWGRTHWGKPHFQSAETLAPHYLRWDDFQAVCRTMDFDGRFRNPYTDRVLGLPEGPP